MKLSEAIKTQKGAPYFIPDCTRADLPTLFKELGFKVGVEIGVSWAQNIVDYCEAGLKVYGIDPYKDDDDITYKKIVSIPGKYGRTFEGVYKLAVERTAKYPNCILVKKTSIEALKDFPKRSLDFVYIDANHDFGFVAMDLMKWTDKIKKGGIIAGHDYYDTQNPRFLRQVRNVVDAYAKTYDYENWYVVGSKEAVAGEKQDRMLSYFLIKHW